MIFSNLKKSLKDEIKNAYYIHGNDVFLMYKAMSLIENACVKNLPDINKIVFSIDVPFTANDIIMAAQVLAMGDERRLVLVKSCKIKANKENIKIVEDFLKTKQSSSCIVFFAGEENEFLSAVKPFCTEVLCNFLSESTLKQVIKKEAENNNVRIDDEAMALLINYCTADMSKITNELVKLFAICENGEITKEIIDENITKEIDFEIYELADNLAKKDRQMALLILDKLLKNKDNANRIIPSLYNMFSRMLFASLNMEDDLIAKELRTKEFAVSKARMLSRSFSKTRLFKICNQILKAEENFKSGKLSLENAINNLIFSIIVN